MTVVGAHHFGRHVDENGSIIIAEFYYDKWSLYAEVIFTKLSNATIGEIRGLLLRKTVKELSTLAKSLGVRLAGSTRKANIVERLLAMAKIGAVRDTSTDDTTTGEIFTGISYITAEVRDALQQLPLFESIIHWKRRLEAP